MQLIRSNKDNYITGNPQITFFKSVYKRNTNFSMETIEIPFNSDITANECTVTGTISRNTGDLLEKMFLHVKLPNKTSAHSGSGIDYIRWTNSTGHAYIKECSILIGNQEIDKHYSVWFDIWNELTDVDNKEYVLINKHNDKEAYLNAGSSTDIDKLDMYIPLQFYFCKNPGLALPLVSLQFVDVKIQITFRKLDFLINCTNNLTNTITTVPTVKLFGNFIFLDKDEKRNFSTKPQEYLIEQIQHINTTLTSSNELNFNHMVKEILWVCRSKNCVETDPTTGTTPVDAANNSTINGMVKGNDYFDYSPNATSNTEYTLNAEGYEPFESATIMLDGNKKFDNKEANYFRMLQPYYYHVKTPEKFIYNYSFALFPEKYQPSGFCDFSSFKSISLDFTSPLNNTDLLVFAVNYNVLKISDGMGGLAYVS